MNKFLRQVIFACAGAAAVLFLLKCSGAYAAPMACSPREDVLAQLSEKFKEQPVSIGLANNGGLLEVLAARDGTTWTVIITMPNGISCLVAAGESWQDLAVPKLTPGEAPI